MSKEILNGLAVFMNGEEEIQNVWKHIKKDKKSQITKFLNEFTDSGLLNVSKYRSIKEGLTDEKQQNLFYLMVCQQLKINSKR